MDCPTMLALRRLNSGIRRRIDSSAVCQEICTLAGANGWILGYLSDHEGEDIFQRDLERDLGISRSGVSKIVAGLEKSGLLERAHIVRDDRLKKLVLTERGRKYTEMIRADNQQLEQQLTEGFSESDLDALQGYLTRMLNNITNTD